MAQPPQESRWPTYSADAESSVPDSPSPEPGGPAAVLPVPAAPQYPVVGAPGSAAAPSRPGYSPHDPLVLAAGGGTVRKEGTWTVPPYLRVHGDLGSVRLDFRMAQPTSQVILVDVSGGVGSILIILPTGWAAQTDRLRPGIGSRKTDVAEEPEPGHPVLVLSGSLGVGSLVVRYPTRGDERRLARRLRREQRHAARAVRRGRG